MVGGVSTVETARAAWSECERQLYAGTVFETSQYERAILAVRAVADHLRASASLEQLLNMWSRGTAEFDPLILATSPSLGPLLNRHIVGAAFALREREIREIDLRQTRLKRIEDARHSGDAWVLLDESGNLQAGLLAPYRSTEMHLATGLGVVSMVQQDPSLGTPIFVVAVVRIDLSSGELLDATPGIADWVEHASLEEFVAYRTALRERICTI
jgi:hypothetical protein